MGGPGSFFSDLDVLPARSTWFDLWVIYGGEVGWVKLIIYKNVERDGWSGIYWRD